MWIYVARLCYETSNALTTKLYSWANKSVFGSECNLAQPYERRRIYTHKAYHNWLINRATHVCNVQYFLNKCLRNTEMVLNNTSGSSSSGSSSSSSSSRSSSSSSSSSSSNSNSRSRVFQSFVQVCSL